MGGLKFANVKAVAHSHIEAICRRVVPAGKKQGDWWVAPVPWREDKNPSLGVRLSTGKWQDFSRGDHGDLIDLVGRVLRLSPSEAVSELARLVGMTL